MPLFDTCSMMTSPALNFSAAWPRGVFDRFLQHHRNSFMKQTGANTALPSDTARQDNP